MWNRYTEGARRAIYHAQQAAARCEENEVRIEHLLKGILTEENTSATHLLAAIGWPRERLMERLQRTMRVGDPRMMSLDMRLDSTAKQAIEGATHEASQLGSDLIGTEHLLLGTISAEQEPTRRLFQECGIRADALRAALATMNVSGSARPAESRSSSRYSASRRLSWSSFTENTRTALRQAQREAARLGGNIVWPEHLLLGLLRGESGMSHRLLAAFGVTPADLLRELEPVVSRGPAHDSEREMQLHPSARAVLEEARQQAARTDSKFLGTDHVLVALAATAGEPSASLFRTRGISADSLRAAADNLYPAVWSAPAERRPETTRRPQQTQAVQPVGMVRVQRRQHSRRSSRGVGILVLIILLGLIALLLRLLMP